MQPLHVAAQFGQRNELRRQRRRMVERLADLPRQTSCNALALQVAGRKVDTEPHLVVITRGKTLFDRLAHAVDPDDQFRLVVQIPAERRHVERIVVAQQRRVGLHEELRFPGQIARMVQFGDMLGVVPSDADDFHFLSSLSSSTIRAPTRSEAPLPPISRPSSA